MNESTEHIILKAHDKKRLIAMCLWLLVEQIEKFNRTVHVRHATRSRSNPLEVLVPALTQAQVDMIYREGRYPLLLPLFFLIHSTTFPWIDSPEFEELVDVAFDLSQITDDTMASHREDEAKTLAHVRRVLRKYLIEEGVDSDE